MAWPYYADCQMISCCPARLTGLFFTLQVAGCHVQELSVTVADLKSQAMERAAVHRVSFAHPDQQLAPQQQPQYQQQQRQEPQQLYRPQPVLMWDQNAPPADCRQSGSWLPAQGAAAEATQLPQLLLQKLQRTQEKLESRDASARKYKVGLPLHLSCIYSMYDLREKPSKQASVYLLVSVRWLCAFA